MPYDTGRELRRTGWRGGAQLLLEGLEHGLRERLALLPNVKQLLDLFLFSREVW